MDINNLPWIEKYRPKVLEEILSHNEIINTIKTFIKNKCLPHLLFYGPPGCGKTSTIIATAKELYGSYFNFMVMELNASDDRGIDVVRSKIKQFVTAKNAFYGTNDDEKKSIFKLVILDEIDAMTYDAQAILRKIIEDNTMNTRFCLICNYIQNITPALQSRCSKFRFSPISNQDIQDKILSVSKLENITVTESAMDAVIKRSNGDMRKVLNILQSVSMSYTTVSAKNINQCLGYPEKAIMKDILDYLINKPFNESYNFILKIKTENGLYLGDIISEIHNILVEYIITNKTAYPSVKKLSTQQIGNILSLLRSVEYNNSVNTVENIQLSGLVSVFKINQ